MCQSQIDRELNHPPRLGNGVQRLLIETPCLIRQPPRGSLINHNAQTLQDIKTAL